jgi:tRNA(Glu) U13 pseudouridine synthase TruD
VSELSIKLEFSLPSGSYATVLLEEVFGALQIEAGMTRR